MSVLLCTSLGDLTVDLDHEQQPELSQNFLKLCKARWYTSTLIFHVVSSQFAQGGCVRGDGSSGGSYRHYCRIKKEGKYINADDASSDRFLKVKSPKLEALSIQRGTFLAVEMQMTEQNGHNDGYSHIGAQFRIALCSSGISIPGIPFGQVVEDPDDVLNQLDGLYCDAEGRPFVDVRVHRALIIYDPFLDDNYNDLEETACLNKNEDEEGSASPDYDIPPEEIVERRIDSDNINLAELDNPKSAAERQEELEKKEAKSRAVVLEMLGDLPDAEMTAPENVLFVCKLNPATDDEDLELIFSRFDPNANANIVRDVETQDSLCYAFVEFSTKEQCTEAYFKMNNALIDDRRIKVDFSQSVSHMWNRFTQQFRRKKQPPPAQPRGGGQKRWGPQKQKQIGGNPQREAARGTCINRRDDNNYHYRESRRRENDNHPENQRRIRVQDDGSRRREYKYIDRDDYDRERRNHQDRARSYSRSRSRSRSREKKRKDQKKRKHSRKEDRHKEHKGRRNNYPDNDLSGSDNDDRRKKKKKHKRHKRSRDEDDRRKRHHKFNDDGDVDRVRRRIDSGQV